MMPILHIILLLSEAFAAEPLAPIIQNHDQRMPANRRVIIECMSGRASPDKNISCVGAYKYVNEFCSVINEPLFGRRYRKLKTLTFRFEEACDLSGFVDGKLEKFFDIDINSCHAGHATLQDRLVVLQSHDDILNEGFSHNYKRKSCVEYRSYVNLCEFVDGALKKATPARTEFLPQLRFTGNSSVGGCSAGRSAAPSGIYKMTRDLSALSRNPENNVYGALVEKYRSQRGPANARNQTCEEVRNSYANLGCQYFEKYLDEDPIYMDANAPERERSEYKSYQLNRNENHRKQGRGGTAN